MPSAELEPYVGLRDRDYFHFMLNLDSHSDFRPMVRKLAERFLGEARKRQEEPGIDAMLRPFAYTQEAFRARLDEVYASMIASVTRYEADRRWKTRTREDVVESLVQMAPFNQTDGSWLRNIGPVGPVDEVRSLLFGIFMDEVGGGNPELNHANIYTTLLQSADIYLPSIFSRDYVDNKDIQDSSFSSPLFQLVISEFSREYFPEILGMTQYLEWSSAELQSMVLLHEHVGLDPHFYEMHVAIDNVATGHGAKARRAIELYLEDIRVQLGENVMQTQWSRIWDGYVAFASAGASSNGTDEPTASTPAEKVAAMILERAPTARVSHGKRKLGNSFLNDLFGDPKRVMQELIKSGMIVRGRPNDSRFFTLLTPSGPMYKVFSDEEVDTWKTWVISLQGDTD
jgi:Iron-containing redox enzyme